MDVIKKEYSMIEKILKIIRSIDSIDSSKIEDMEINIKRLEVCLKMIDSFMITEKPKDKRIYEGLQCYYLEKLFSLSYNLVVID